MMSTYRTRSVIAMLVALVVLTTSGLAAEESSRWSRFVDPEDGQLDLSEWLLDRRGFLPIPILITEPAVGYGLGIGLAFFHRSEDAPAKESTRPLPPSVSFGAGLYTENGSWAAGGGHFGSWKQDSIRYTGAVGGGSFNLDFYVADIAFAYTIEPVFLLQEILFRVGDSPFFVGLEYTLLDATSTFDLGLDIPGIDPIEFESANAGLGAVVQLDTRDTIFTPDSGAKGDLTVTVFDESLGGDFGYWDAELSVFSFHPVHPRFVLGWRIAAEGVDGDAPFYGLPFIELRGVPAARYQGDGIGQVELEGRWQVRGRWSLIGFFGAGRADFGDIDFNQAGTVLAGGLGFRYLAARALKLHVGMDVARGPEDTAIYFQAGHAWR